MAKKKQATMVEWEEIGEAAKQLRSQIMNFVSLIGGKVHTTHQDQAMNLITRLNGLCSDLENEMFRQHSEKAHIRVFFK